MITVLKTKRAKGFLRETARGEFNESISIYGMSGFGKSTCYINRDVPSEIGKKFILVLDQPGETGDALFRSAVGRYPRLLLDDLSRPGRLLPVCLCPVSDDPDQAIRDYLNKVAIERFIEIGSQAPDDEVLVGPMKRYYTNLACQIYQSIPAEIRKDIPFRAVPRIFNPWDDWHNYLIGVGDPSLGMPLVRARALHESTRISTLSPAERFMRRFLDEPAVQLRDSNKPIPIDRLIQENWIVIIKGGSRESSLMVGSTWVNAVIDHFEDGGLGEARIILDEYNNCGTATPAVIRALNMKRKRGLSFTFISQTPSEDDYVRKSIDQNCGTLYAHRCASWEVAEYVAKALAGRLNPNKVKYYTQRMMHDGYEPFTRRTSSKGSSQVVDLWSPNSKLQQNNSTQEADAERAIYRTVEDPHYESLSDQITLIAKEIQNDMKVGERWVSRNGQVFKEYVPLPPKRPWNYCDEMIEAYLEEMRQSEFFVTPNPSLPEIPCRFIRPTGNGKPSTGSGRTHRHTPKSKKSENTQRTKRPKGPQSDGPEKGTSST